MIQLEQILAFFPQQIQNNPEYKPYMLKEYIQLMTLDYLSATPYIRKIAFIGGTNLRLVKGIDRFSEDLDFDCKDLSETDFMEMTDGIVAFLKSYGLPVEPRDKPNDRLTAFRRNLYFPEWLFELGLSGHKEKRFLIKIESQDQGVIYSPTMTHIRGCGFFFPFPVPPDDILCAMKLSALLARRKGRDFYDAMFLLAQSPPNYDDLMQKPRIRDWQTLKAALLQVCAETDLSRKSQDFEHLLFPNSNSDKIQHFADFIRSLPYM
jgi:predicted nucleotidyltransferase component of viral defense system